MFRKVVHGGRDRHRLTDTDQEGGKWDRHGVRTRPRGVCVLLPLKLSVDQSSRSCDLKRQWFQEFVTQVLGCKEAQVLVWSVTCTCRENEALLGWWNPKKPTPVRHGSIIQFIFNFSDKIFVRHRWRPTLFLILLPDVTWDQPKKYTSRYPPTSGRRTYHHRSSQTYTSSTNPIRLQPILPSSTQPQRHFH